ncbi:MAG: SUMF1/EgtB/PvdO family nonheme iron enzyme [Bacteroidales bacterium]
MKNLFLILMSFSFLLNAFSQPSNVEDKPNNMVFIPAGTFTMTIEENNNPMNISASVDAFWMSDEITNSEYREFVDFVKNNPELELCWIDFDHLAQDQENDVTNTKREDYLICVQNFEIIDNIIDTKNMPYADYFNNAKYDTYPVVGVSQENARYYCIWRSDKENRIRQKEGKTYNYHNYRLPIEAEWAYVASHTHIKKNKSKSKIKPSKSGPKNDFGLYNFEGNVSEWTASSKENRWTNQPDETVDKDMIIYRGGSWISGLDLEERNELNNSEAKAYIGFRIVQSYSK